MANGGENSLVNVTLNRQVDLPVILDQQFMVWPGQPPIAYCERVEPLSLYFTVD
jgi:hypothetical protein